MSKTLSPCSKSNNRLSPSSFNRIPQCGRVRILSKICNVIHGKITAFFSWNRQKRSEITPFTTGYPPYLKSGNDKCKSKNLINQIFRNSRRIFDTVLIQITNSNSRGYLLLLFFWKYSSAAPFLRIFKAKLSNILDNITVV